MSESKYPPEVLQELVKKSSSPSIHFEEFIGLKYPEVKQAWTLLTKGGIISDIDGYRYKIEGNMLLSISSQDYFNLNYHKWAPDFEIHRGPWTFEALQPSNQMELTAEEALKGDPPPPKGVRKHISYFNPENGEFHEQVLLFDFPERRGYPMYEA